MPTYTLSSLLTIVDSGFKQLFGGFSFRLRAEILSSKNHGGKRYLQLGEFNEQGDLLAKVQALIFDPQNIVPGYEAHDVIKKQCTIQGRCSFHQQWGLKVIIDSLTLHDQSDQELTIQSILNALEIKHIIHANKEKKIGFPPVHLGIITSKGSEGLQDFISILQSHQIPFTYDILTASVHGNTAKEEIVVQFEQLKDSAKQYTLIAILRGGGDQGGLSRQNDESLATCICECSFPVMVAIGHTSNQSVLDTVAKISAKTPSDGAYILLEYLSMIEHTLDTIRTKIQTNYDQILENSAGKYLSLKQNIDHLFNQKRRIFSQKIEERHGRIMRAQSKDPVIHLYTLDGQKLGTTKIKEIAVNDKIIIRTSTFSLQAIIINKNEIEEQ